MGTLDKENCCEMLLRHVMQWKKNGRVVVEACCELLKVVLTIRNGSSDSLVQKIDAILGPFTQQLCFKKTQRMKDNTITDFFKS